MKFRVWDQKRKKMWTEECDDAVLVMSFIGRWSLFGGAHGLEPNTPVITDSDGILMQSLGQFDGNGQEIFEGDIVNQGGVITGKDIETIPPEWKVVGNIYENPDLL